MVAMVSVLSFVWSQPTSEGFAGFRAGRREPFSPLGGSKGQTPTLERTMFKLSTNNEHLVDRIVRVAAGLALLAAAFVGPRTPFGYLGIIPLATGLLGSCPVYSLLGLSTRRAPRH
jgi:hypothetical protein